MFSAIVAFLSMFACSGGGGGGEGGDGSDSEGGGSGTISVQTFRVITDGSGSGPVEFDLPNETNKFALDVEAPGSNVKIVSVTNSVGQEFVVPGGVQLSLGSEFFPGINTAVIPSRGFDPPVAGLQHFRLSAVTEPGMVPISVTLQSRLDPDLHGGTIQINVFRVGAAASGDDTRSAVQRALDVMRKIYSEQAGISLDVNEFDTAGPENLPSPISGNEFYRASSSGVRSPAVNIFIGADVDVGAGAGAVLGVAGGLPAPTIPSARSATAVSLLSGAGPDGVFDDSEIRLLGETFAHEVGHYLGLFHPIDFDSFFLVTDKDVLPDTPECFSFLDCAANRDLVQNVMFPLPVSQELADFLASIADLLQIGGETTPQDRLTAEQRSVLNLNVLVD